MSALFPVSGPGGARPSSLIGPSPQTTRVVAVPPPNSGINAVDGLLAMESRGPEDSIFQFNLIPSQYGTKVRTGYYEWATQVGTGEVKTILPFTGSVVTNNRLFAAGKNGIFNVSASVINPAAAIAFPVSDATSGYGQWTNFTTIAGHFQLYCDETNGYYVYDETAGTWAKIAMGAGATQIANVDPALFVQPVIFKSRVWYVEKNSARAWYLAAGTIYGAATAFNFGNKFKTGGYLVGLYVWTVDGGEGTDDYLVAISSGGDVVIYKGNDPASATDFVQHGSWFIGPPPVGRRIAGSFGGELYVLSTYGVIPLTKLIAGALIQQDNIYISRKITPLINGQMIASRTVLGWEVKLVPTENLLLVSVPKQTDFRPIQFVQSLNTSGWAVYRDIPYLTGETWQGVFYIGDSTGRVLIHDGVLDNTSIAGVLGIPISWSTLSVFQDSGAVGRYKRVQFIRPVFLTEKAPSFSVVARYDYDLSEAPLPLTATVTIIPTWDVDLWDLALWGGTYEEVERTVGGTGIGRCFAIGINGSSAARTILIRYDAMLDDGGAL